MLLTGTVIMTILFANGYLNSFIKTILNIVGPAFFIPLSFFISFITNHIVKPIKNFIRRIHIPHGIKIVLYLLIGMGILVFDHFYSTSFFEADETTFYHFIFQGTTYWITKEGLTFGGFFVGLGVLLLLIQILEGINKILSIPIHISIIIRK